jgi:hypothetical protein
MEQQKTLKEEAQAFVPKQSKNIADLPQIDLSTPMKDGEGVDKEGAKFKYKFVEVNGEEYRVPGVVLGQIKDILESNPNMKSFKVKKSGKGLDTRYTTIPLS